MDDKKSFCMSSYLMYRYLFDDSVNFGLPHKNGNINFERRPPTAKRRWL